MAFTANQVQGVFGEFKPVMDIAGGTLTANQSQGIFGEFKSVLDGAQASGGGGGGAIEWPTFQSMGFWSWRYVLILGLLISKIY